MKPPRSGALPAVQDGDDGGGLCPWRVTRGLELAEDAHAHAASLQEDAVFWMLWGNLCR